MLCMEKNWGKEADRLIQNPEDRKLFVGYASDAKRQTGSKRIGDLRIRKYLASFTTIRRATKKGVCECIRNFEGLRKAVKAIEDSKYLPYTKQDNIKLLGSLYNFSKKGERSLKYADRDLKELVSYSPRNSERRAPKPIISREEVRELSNFGDTLDRAILFLLFESGARIGEFVGLRKSNITTTKEGLDILIPSGKTGQRRIIVVEATKYVNAWVGQHPTKGKDAPLWISPATRKALGGPAIAKRIRLMAERLNEHRKKQGIPLFKKSVNPHNFRHSRASELGAEPGMTEPILCKYFGWEIGSDMPRTYLHISDEKVRKAVLQTYGKAKLEERKIITHRTCLRCKEENPVALNYCGRCGADIESGKVISSLDELTARVAELEELAKGSLRERMKEKAGHREG